jgi:hypothetical protein
LAKQCARGGKFAAVAMVATVTAAAALEPSGEAPCLTVDRLVFPDHFRSASQQCEYVKPETHQDSRDSDRSVQSDDAEVRGRTVTRDFPAAMEIFTRQEQPPEVRQPVLFSGI